MFRMYAYSNSVFGIPVLYAYAVTKCLGIIAAVCIERNSRVLNRAKM
jgi:hypothetical protein